MTCVGQETIREPLCPSYFPFCEDMNDVGKIDLHVVKVLNEEILKDG